MAQDKLLFNYLNAINMSKKDFLLDPNCEEAIRFKREYVPYMINGFLAGSVDTLMFANEMNNNPHMPPERQFVFLLHSVKRKKRFTMWLKPTVNKEVELLCQYYGVSNKVAKEYLKLHTKEQMAEIKEALTLD